MHDGANYGSTPQVPSKTEHVALDAGHRTRVILFTCFICLVVVAEGYDFGVLNGAMVRIKDDLKISTLHVSLLVTATPLFVMPGSLVGGALADAVGRRGALAACCSMLVVGPVGMALSPSVGLLLATRAIVGFGIGMGLVIVSMYIAEVAPAELRGRLIALEDIFLNIGMVTGYLMNWLLLGMKDDWRWMLGLGAVLPLIVLAMICLPQMPESPRWLISRGRNDEAEKVLIAFVGAEEAQLAMREITAQLQQNTEEFVTWHQVLCSWHDGKIRRMLLAGLVVAVAQVGGGYLAISYYSSTVLKRTMSEEAAFRATIVMGIVKLSVALMTLAVLERVGRRPMLQASVSVCGLAAAWLAVSFTIDIGNFAQAFGFALFMAGFSLGLGPVGFVYVSEVFITRWRGKALAFVLFVSRVVGALSTFTFPLALESLGASMTFWILCAANLIFGVFICVFVFETHGRTLENMEALFDSSPRAHDFKSP